MLFLSAKFGEHIGRLHKFQHDRLTCLSDLARHACPRTIVADGSSGDHAIAGWKQFQTALPQFVSRFDAVNFTPVRRGLFHRSRDEDHFVARRNRRRDE